MSLKALRAVTAKAVKDYNHGIVKANANTLKHKIAFDSPQLTYMFGGFSYDRIHQAFGPESSGKSSIYTYIAGQLQRKMPEEIERLAQEAEKEGMVPLRKSGLMKVAQGVTSLQEVFRVTSG